MEICPYCRKGYLQSGVCGCCGKEVGDGNRPLPSGTLLNDRYLVDHPLGSGGFGITYQAWDQRQNCWAAVKELFPLNTAVRPPGGRELYILRDQPDQARYFEYALNNFIKETRTMEALRDYPEVLRLFGTFEQFGTAYYAMEYLEGVELKTLLLRYGPIPWTRLAGPVRDVTEALKVLHSLNLLHRDISPDNIILTKSGRAKLIDFGSVRNFDTSNHFTTIIKGAFSPQELFLENGNQGPWTDVYLLCATVYYLLCGKLPKHVSTRLSTMFLNHSDPLESLAALAPSVPAHVAHAVEKGLAIQIPDRYQSVAELASELFPSDSSGDGQGAGYGRIKQELPPPSRRKSPQLYFRTGRLAGKRYPIQQNMYVSLGRERGNTVQFPEDTLGVSRFHCLFYQSQTGEVYVWDQNSTYGTMLDGKRIQPQQWFTVSPGQTLRIGNGNEEIQYIT